MSKMRNKEGCSLKDSLVPRPICATQSWPFTPKNGCGTAVGSGNETSFRTFQPRRSPSAIRRLLSLLSEVGLNSRWKRPESTPFLVAYFAH